MPSGPSHSRSFVLYQSPCGHVRAGVRVGSRAPFVAADSLHTRRHTNARSWRHASVTAGCRRTPAHAVTNVPASRRHAAASRCRRTGSRRCGPRPQGHQTSSGREVPAAEAAEAPPLRPASRPGSGRSARRAWRHRRHEAASHARPHAATSRGTNSARTSAKRAALLLCSARAAAPSGRATATRGRTRACGVSGWNGARSVAQVRGARARPLTGAGRRRQAVHHGAGCQPSQSNPTRSAEC